MWKTAINFFLVILVAIAVSGTTEDFTCSDAIPNTSLYQAVILPKKDIVLLVNSSQDFEVLCRFDPSKINAKNVFFKINNTLVLSQNILNESTIQYKIPPSPIDDKYELECIYKPEEEQEQFLCSRIVKVGYPPLDIKDLTCLSRNANDLRCDWHYQYNPIHTKYYNITYSFPRYFPPKPCPDLNIPFNTTCTWTKSMFQYIMRDEMKMHYSARNLFNETEFTHKLSLKSVVLPAKVNASVSVEGPFTVTVKWGLPYPMDSLSLWHFVEYKLQHGEWQKFTLFDHEHDPRNGITTQKNFEHTGTVPYAYTRYYFRVRIHNANLGHFDEHMWSDYDTFTAFTKPTVPTTSPRVHPSGFEVIDHLHARDVYIYYEHINRVDQNGPDFDYKLDVYDKYDNRLNGVIPVEKTGDQATFFKFVSLGKDELRFSITPMNSEGLSPMSSQVIVPDADFMPKKTGLFTVITRNKGTVFSLYWVPAKSARSDMPVDSYTIYWCLKSNGERCRKKLNWEHISDPNSLRKDFSQNHADKLVLFEKNFTSLASGVYTFGVAANAGPHSSGIKWANCIVDERDAPEPPSKVEAYAVSSRKVEVAWSLKCSSLSAVPLGFNITFCKVMSGKGRCDDQSQIEHKTVNSPTFTNATIDNLHPGYSYAFSVAILSLVGEGRPNMPPAVKLPEEIPSGPPSDLQMSFVTNSSVSLTWKPPAPSQHNGIITYYAIRTFPHIKDQPFFVNAAIRQENYFTLEHLHPYTNYTIKVVACTKLGCGEKTPARIVALTEDGVPAPLEKLRIDLSNWRLTWELDECNSRMCLFDVIVPKRNGTFQRKDNVTDTMLSLTSVGIECNNTVMHFSVRPKGVDKNGRYLFGNWSTVVKPEEECPTQQLALWVIIVVTIVCIVFTVTIILVMKCGWGAIMKMIKDCSLKIDVPVGLQSNDYNKERKDFYKEGSNHAHRTSEPTTLLLQPNIIFNGIANGTNTNTTIQDLLHITDNTNANLPLESNTSEEENLIAFDSKNSPPVVPDEGKNSAFNFNDAAANLNALSPCSTHEETSLRQRSPYVQHNLLPHPVSEGYVTAQSAPDLHNLYNEKQYFVQNTTAKNGDLQSNDNSNDDDDKKLEIDISSCIGSGRRNSTGYIQISDFGIQMPQLNGDCQVVPTTMPSYSKHVPEPAQKLHPDIASQLPLQWTTSSYVTILPAKTNAATGAPVQALIKRPPSLPSLLPVDLKEEGNREEAYSRVGNVGSPFGLAPPLMPPNSQAYVSVGQMQPHHFQQQKRPSSYVTCEQASLMAIGGHNSPTGSRAPHNNYVKLQDDGPWPHHKRNAAQMQGKTGTSLDGCSSTSSSPEGPLSSPEGGGIGIDYNQDKTVVPGGWPSSSHGVPCLSKQSSGYVSQETIPVSEPVVISPKRLMAQNSRPHTVIFSPSHQGSMV